MEQDGFIGSCSYRYNGNICFLTHIQYMFDVFIVFDQTLYFHIVEHDWDWQENACGGKCSGDKCYDFMGICIGLRIADATL